MLEIQQLELRQAGAADKAAKTARKSAQRKRGQVRATLEEMYVWQQFGNGGDGARLTDSDVRGLFQPGSQPPWRAPGVTTAAQRMYHGRRFLEAAVHRARAGEELGILTVEKARLARWLEVVQVQLGVARAKRQECAGSVFLLDQHLALVQDLKSQLQHTSIPDPS